jgi:hypothetical protein
MVQISEASLKRIVIRGIGVMECKPHRRFEPRFSLQPLHTVPASGAGRRRLRLMVLPRRGRRPHCGLTRSLRLTRLKKAPRLLHPHLHLSQHHRRHPLCFPRDLSPWGMFMQADIVVKAVMIGLALASLVTWTRQPQARIRPYRESIR